MKIIKLTRKLEYSESLKMFKNLAVNIVNTLSRPPCSSRPAVDSDFNVMMIGSYDRLGLTIKQFHFIKLKNIVLVFNYETWSLRFQKITRVINIR